MKKKFVFCTLSLALLLIGCSPYTLLNSKVYNSADLEAEKTFRVVEPTSKKLPPRMTMVDYQNIADAIRQQLVMRGYTESDDSPILVNFGVSIENNIQTQPAIPPGGFPSYWNGFGGYANYWMSPRNMYLNSYYQNAELITGIQKDGVLTIDLVDMKNKSYMWSASVSSIMEANQDQFREKSDLEELIATAFKKFPVPIIGASK